MYGINPIHIRRNVLVIANRFKAEFGFSTAQVMSWKIVKAAQAYAIEHKHTGINITPFEKAVTTRERMKREIITFTYWSESKKEIRKAVGTLNAALLPTPSKAKRTRKQTSYKITYFDIEKNGYRSFLPENLITVLSRESIAAIIRERITSKAAA